MLNPDMLQSRTVTVFTLLTSMMPKTPAGKAGQPGATASPGLTPVTVIVWSAAHEPFAMLGKLNVAVFIK
jgi:hypothetical protein